MERFPITPMGMDELPSVREDSEVSLLYNFKYMLKFLNN